MWFHLSAAISSKGGSALSVHKGLVATEVIAYLTSPNVLNTWMVLTVYPVKRAINLMIKESVL
jgi:hypothetical protein